MPNSCKSILNKLKRDGRITQFEYDKLVRNLHCPPKPVVCIGGGNNMPISGYLDKSTQLIYLGYVTVEGLYKLGYQIIEDKEDQE